ncbi:MAG: hypothetical protein IV104_02195 [Acidovorax sp.]|nr:hypothetical protein [Acidovorax sp.]
MRAFSLLTRPRLPSISSTRVLAVGLVLLLAVLASTASLMWRELDHMQHRDRQRLELLASVMEAQASQMLDAGKPALDNLATSLVNDPKALAQLPFQQAQYLQSLPFLRSLALLNAQGQVRLSTHTSDQERQLDLRRLTTQPLSDDRMVVGLRQTGQSLTRNPSDRLGPAQSDFIPLLRRVQLTPNSHVVLVAQLSPNALITYQQRLLNMSSSGAQAVLALSDGSVLNQLGGDVSAAEPVPNVQPFPQENQGSYEIVDIGRQAQAFQDNALPAQDSTPSRQESRSDAPSATTTSSQGQALPG